MVFLTIVRLSVCARTRFHLLNCAVDVKPRQTERLLIAFFGGGPYGTPSTTINNAQQLSLGRLAPHRGSQVQRTVFGWDNMGSVALGHLQHVFRTG